MKIERYCRECGLALVYIVEKGSFDPFTGKQNLFVFGECPKYRTKDKRLFDHAHNIPCDGPIGPLDNVINWFQKNNISYRLNWEKI